MRRRNGVRAAALAVLLAAPLALAQEAAPRTTYWPLRKIDFPIPVANFQREAKKPSKLRFYVAREGGRFDLLTEKELDKLDPIAAGRGQKGFSYTTAADGVYDFAVMLVYPDGSTDPKESNLLPEWRVTFDTRPPTLDVRQAAATRLEWDAADDHLGPTPVTVETRWPGGKWKAIDRKFSARDGYTWQGLKENDPLEVRVIARDKAQLETASRIFSLPGRGDGGRLPAPPLGGDDPPARPSSSSTGFGNPGDFDPVGQPPTDYANRRELTVVSKLSRVTRSGVRKAYLWVNDGKTGWKLHHADDQSIAGNAVDQIIRMGFTAPADGLYGFLVIPESAAGTKQADPVPGTPPQFYVYVDTQPPAVQVKRADAGPGGAAGPRVTVEWGVTETGSGLMPDSITLEYGPKETGPWTKIIDRKVENTGRYTWDVDDKSLWQCYVKVTATDRAGNSGSHVYAKEVFLDLEKPAAVIERVTGGGAGAPPASPPPPGEQSRRPSDPPPATPTGNPGGSAPSTVPTGSPPPSGPDVPKLDPSGTSPPPLPPPPK